MNFIKLIPSIILIIICNTFSFAEILHNDFSNAIEGIYKKRSVETVEKFESFLEKNPSLAKTMRYGVEGINGVLMATGVKGLLTSGLPKALVALGFGEALSTASSWAGSKVEGMVAEVATSESEAQRFMKALKTCAETAGVVVGVKIATKTAKSLKASKIQAPVIKDALSERPIIKDGKVWLGDKELGPVRPTPRQSELDVGSQLGPNSRPQVSFSHGKEVRWGAPDSVRPDHIIGNVASIEVKNYDVNKNASKLIYDVSKQALKRVNHLPEGMQQYVRIDARGQIISQELRRTVQKKISEKTQGIITPDRVSFFE